MRKLKFIPFLIYLIVFQNLKATDTCKASFAIVEKNNFGIEFYNISVGKNLHYTWDFGDGFSSTLFQPSHSYKQHQIVPVQLIVHDTVDGCRDTTLQEVEIQQCTTCLTRILAVPGYADKMVKFNATGYGSKPVNDPGYAYLTHWNFGDGNFSEKKAPEHNYTAYGTYTVTITTFDSMAACTCARTQEVVVSKHTHLAISNCENGNWNDAKTWVNNHIPTQGDTVLIYHAVLLNQDYATGKTGYVYINNQASLCGHQKLHGAVLQFGDLSLDTLIVEAQTRSVSDYYPMNISGQFSVICCLDAWSFPTTDLFGCASASNCNQNGVSSFSETARYTLFPQPVSSTSILKINAPLPGTYTLQIFTLSGQLIHQSYSNTGEYEIKQENLPAGNLYFVLKAPDHGVIKGPVLVTE